MQLFQRLYRLVSKVENSVFFNNLLKTREVGNLPKETINPASMLMSAQKVFMTATLKCQTVKIRMEHTLVSVCTALKVII